MVVHLHGFSLELVLWRTLNVAFCGTYSVLCSIRCWHCTTPTNRNKKSVQLCSCRWTAFFTFCLSQRNISVFSASAMTCHFTFCLSQRNIFVFRASAMTSVISLFVCRRETFLCSVPVLWPLSFHFQAKCEFYMDNMSTFRQMKSKLGESSPPEVLEFIQRTMDKNVSD